MFFIDDGDSKQSFDFIFLFTCRELNLLLENIKTVEELFQHKYPEIFKIINPSDLESISERVLIIVDGLDEFQNIYNIRNTKNRDLNLDLLSSLIDTKNRFLKNHKVIACGRPKACEFVKQHFAQMSKTIEVVGFNKENIVKYIDNFFINEEQKAKKVKEAIEISNNLKVMATVPVFLWVICCVYGENLITKTLNTYTELYTYTTLIFLRNHFRENSQQKDLSLVEILENDEIMNSVFALMSLSVQTYMENKVLFEEDDIKSFICPTQVERTGMIVRYKRDNLNKPVYQFKHLVLQEFFCSLSLSVTECVSPNPSNRELSSCTPVIYGIKRLLKEGENKIFISFFNKLLAINHIKNETEYVEISYDNPIFNKFLIKKFQ